MAKFANIRGWKVENLTDNSISRIRQNDVTDAPQPSAHVDSPPQWPEADIHYLIFKCDDFVVFLDADLDLDWQTSDRYDQAGPKDPIEHNDILNRAASLECTPNDQHKRSVRLNFKRMVGEAVARSLEGDYENANKMLEQARQYISDRNVEKARYWQLVTAGSIGLFFAVIGTVLWALRALLTRSLGETPFFLICSGVAGSFGSVLSMIFRMGHTFPTSEAPRALHILEASSRILAGCLSGVLVAGAVQLGLILPVFKSGQESHLVMLLSGMIGGASERWAPSLIARFESGEDKRQAKRRQKS